MTDPSQHYVKKHVDDQDITFQYGLALGDFTGGELTCWAEDGSTQTLDYTDIELKPWLFVGLAAPSTCLGPGDRRK